MLNTKLGRASLHHEKFLIPINLLCDSSVLAMSHSLYLDTSLKYFLIFLIFTQHFSYIYNESHSDLGDAGYVLDSSPITNHLAAAIFLELTSSL